MQFLKLVILLVGLLFLCASCIVAEEGDTFPSLPTDELATRIIFPNEHIQAVISEKMPEQIYLFPVMAGDAVKLDLEKIDGDLVPFLRLWRQTGVIIAEQEPHDLAGRHISMEYIAEALEWYLVEVRSDPALEKPTYGTFDLILTGTTGTSYQLLDIEQPLISATGTPMVDSFEYGGHVTNAGTSAGSLMKDAGMTWMKVQLRYNLGDSPDISVDAINDAHAQGFKIMLGIVGYSNDLAAGGSAYIDEFTNFLGGVAVLGPDAIEVWNEPNIDREWPYGQISGETYADILRQAYQKIKDANSSVRVISAAPAPTGAEAVYPGQVVNDNNWLLQMIDAGGLQYVDCVGVHYHEGIVPPSQISDDPRDDYYTRYFWGMVNTYWYMVDGQRPLCFTELGYLTPEGFPNLPTYYTWAQDTTLDQQAEWLAEAASLSAASGKVQMMIIWNVDFTDYGADPMAGYAIIRPDGSCPACDALAAMH